MYMCVEYVVTGLWYVDCIRVRCDASMFLMDNVDVNG